jgi:hypothetical protein
MDPIAVGKSNLTRLTAKWTVGLVAKTWYYSKFGLYWERKSTEKEKIISDWRRIFRNSSGVRKPLYISAANLDTMGPMIHDILEDPNLCNIIKEVRVRHLSNDLFTFLTTDVTKPSQAHSFFPLINTRLLDSFEKYLEELKLCLLSANIPLFIAPWERLPPFHGSIFNNYIHYCRWEIDENGLITNRTRGIFLHRDHDHEKFERYLKMFESDFIPWTQVV